MNANFRIEPRLLDDFLEMGDKNEVLKETKYILELMSNTLSFDFIKKTFDDIDDLFAGKFPGYQKCNTEYHDLRHTTDIILASARLMHGMTVNGESFNDREISLGVLAAIFHDTGYIQTDEDTKGTGAKYTATHVRRSVEFVKKYYHNRGYPKQDGEDLGQIICCTGLDVNLSKINFTSGRIKLVGQILGAADLLGQMGDRYYVEKLLFLYHEFEEANIPGYKDEFDLLKKTIKFNDFVKKRMKKEYGSVDKHMKAHFKVRWKQNKDFYKEAIKTHIKYLEDLINEHPDNYRDYLRRGGLVEKLEKSEKK